MNHLKKYLENEISDRLKKIAKVKNKSTKQVLKNEVEKLKKRLSLIEKHIWKAA